MLAAVDADFPALDAQRFVQRDGLEIFDGHLLGEGDDVVELVDLAHGIVEDAGDDAAVAVAGRSGVALAETEVADEGLAGFVVDEFQAHAVGIVLAADKAVVLLEFEVAGFVAVDFGLAGHADDFNVILRGRLKVNNPHALLDSVTLVESQNPHPAQRARKGGAPAAGITNASQPDGARDPSTAGVLRFREARPPLRITELAEIVLLTPGGILYTYRFWKSLDWSACEIESTEH